MGYPLTQLKFVIAMQAKINAVTSEDLAALKAGEPVPEGATVVGELSPTLKALMCVRNKLTISGIQMVDEVMTKLTAGESIDQNVELARQKELAGEVSFYDAIFWTAVKAEFPELAGMSMGYGPNFEVYMFPAKQLSLAELLGGGDGGPVLRIILR